MSNKHLQPIFRTLARFLAEVFVAPFGQAQKLPATGAPILRQTSRQAPVGARGWAHPWACIARRLPAAVVLGLSLALGSSTGGAAFAGQAWVQETSPAAGGSGGAGGGVLAELTPPPPGRSAPPSPARPVQPGGGAKPPKPAGTGAGGGAAVSAEWTIVLQSFRKETQAQEAAQTLRAIQTRGALPQARLEERGAALIITAGRFESPTSPQARKELQRIHEMEVEGGRPYVRAFMMPPPQVRGANPELDLRNAKKLQGPWALYTLQIGAYGRGDLKKPSAQELAEARAVAEKAAAQLRREGDLAFYYHGPNFSMVTVGLFGEEDYNPAEGLSSTPMIDALRKKYPHNLLNGRGVRRTMNMTDSQGKPQRVEMLEPSKLVRVPAE